uniref:Leucine--tRNA ligase ubiquitin-like domain-containing protein n=2 Tax=Pectinophora gossypiella TaxID=13191 RepID=A0A1E1WN91_PECGO
MPFVQATREHMQRVGADALSVGLPYDEASVLEDNKHYLINTLDLDAIEVKYTDDPEAPEKTREDCTPGQPHINFIAEPAVDVTCINPTAMNGLFSVAVSLNDGDSIEKVKAKIAKEVKAIKDVTALKLWRYKDPALGPRKIPVQGDHETKCIILDNSAVLKVDVSAGKVALVSNGKNLDLGTQMVYTYEK